MDRTIPIFTKPEERDKFIIDHADKFVLTKARDRSQRFEFTQLDAAVVTAEELKSQQGGMWMIYAVYGVYDTFVQKVG